MKEREGGWRYGNRSEMWKMQEDQGWRCRDEKREKTEGRERRREEVVVS